jgi:hypothetical protein
MLKKLPLLQSGMSDLQAEGKNNAGSLQENRTICLNPVDG